MIGGSDPRHALNNALSAIAASAELALDRVEDPTVREELQVILTLVDDAAALAAALEAPRDRAI